MGIYPTSDYKPGHNGSLVRTYSEPGIEIVTVYMPVLQIENRTECFCCSCPDYSHDPACRNHGFAAKRPCELHDMPGSTWDPEFMDGEEDIMPESVQAYRAKYKEEW